MFSKIAALFKKEQPPEPKQKITQNRYEGELVNGVRHGTGTMYYANGDIYKGKWHNGVVHGFGEFYHAKSGARYVGEFSNSKFSGHGKMTYANGNVYDGHFLNGKREGDGTLSCSDGRRFEGNWLNDQMIGYGTCYFPDGRVYRGMYVNNVATDGFMTQKNKHGDWVLERYSPKPKYEAGSGITYEVILLSYPDECKMRTIKEVREITGYGLAMAKDIVENVPQWIKRGVSLDEAQQAKSLLEAAGAQVEIK